MAGNNERESFHRQNHSHEDLQRQYSELLVVHNQTLKRLQRAEAVQSQIQQRHEQELIKIAANLKQKIQSVELKQLRNVDELDDLKQQMKFELTLQYRDAVDELTKDSEQSRKAFADLCLKHAILKTEFEAIQTSVTDIEEKHRLKSENQLVQWNAERDALLARIEQLSTTNYNLNRAESSTAKDEAALGTLKAQTTELRERCVKLESDLRRGQVAAQTEIQSHLRKLKQIDEEKEKMTKNYTKTLAELVQTQQKLETSTVQIDRLAAELAKIQEENENLRLDMQFNSADFSTQLMEERAKLEKERDERSFRLEALEKQYEFAKEQSTKFESLYRQAEIRSEEMQRTARQDLENEKRLWDDQKLNLESKIRELDHVRRDDEQKFKREIDELELRLKRALWDKEKLAENLARMEIEKARSDQANESDTKNDQLSQLTKELAEQRTKFESLSEDFKIYRSKQRQFNDVFELIDDQVEKTMKVDEGADVQLMIDDLKTKISTAMKKASTSQSEKSVVGKRRRDPKK